MKLRSARVMSTDAGDLRERPGFPEIGRIPAGIKVPTKAVGQNSKCMQAYHEGVAAGASFDQIQEAMMAMDDCPTVKDRGEVKKKIPLTMTSCSYWRITQNDFTTPGAAQYIIDTYAEDGPDGRQVYRLPVVMPVDDIDQVFTEEFAYWKWSSKVHWSEPNPEDDDYLWCMKKEEVTVTKRRRWKNLESIPVRPCDPDDCDHYAKGFCKHSATLWVQVPGVSGIGAIRLSFSSKYGAANITKALVMVKQGLGRINGTYNGKPIFWLYKSLDEVRRNDWDTGKQLKEKKWIIHLDAPDIDLTQGDQLNRLPAPEQQALPSPEPAEQEQEEAIQGEVVQDPPAAGSESADHLKAACWGIAQTLDKDDGEGGKRKWTKEDLKEWVSEEFGMEHWEGGDVKKLAEMVEELKLLKAPF